MSPAPTVAHQLVSFEIQKVIDRSCESDFIVLSAPVDMILSPTEVRQPDLVLVNRKPPIPSPGIPCISFTMATIMQHIPRLSDDRYHGA